MASTSDFFRSAEMEYVSIVMQEHISHQAISCLGGFSCLQFTDLNPHCTPVQRTYTSQIQRCDMVEKKIEYFESMLEKYDVKSKFLYDVNDFLHHPSLDQENNNFLQKLEDLVEDKERSVVLLDNLRENLVKNYSHQILYKHVLDEVLNRNSGYEESENKGDIDGLRFKVVCGIISSQNRAKFERVIFRMSRGNCQSSFFPLDLTEEEESLNLNIEDKFIFIITFQSQLIEDRIMQFVDTFDGEVFDINTSSTQLVMSEKASTEKMITEQKAVLAKSEDDMVKMLDELTQWLQIWKWVILREKSVYYVLNSCKQEVNGVLRAEGWCLKSKKDLIVSSLTKKKGLSGVDISFKSVETVQSQKKVVVPTFFETNKVTGVFQVLIDTYGVPRYREANPALFSVVTFPFLFGVMFGDLGHGFILFLVSLMICLKEDVISKIDLGEMGNAMFSARYFLLMMGFFSFFCGLMYNDYFAMGLEIFPTTWHIENQDFAAGDTVTYIKGNDSEVYPVGIDPTWHHAENGLLFFNSVKMKMAVIFGVVQMTMGLLIKVSNAIHFDKKLDLICEAIPQLIFMLGLFGYMCFLILYKWSLDWGTGCSRETLNCNPPSLITTLIDMALNIGTVDEEMILYEGQGSVQTVLLLASVLMVPIMIFPKPIILSRRLKAEQAKHGFDRVGTSTDSEAEKLIEGSKHEDEGEEHSASDFWVHQGIETVEFCLSCLSNTASYLRLWALSLAHSQLSAVFLEQLLLNYVTVEGPLGVIITFLGFGAFAGATLAVILIMDNMECFLHALRLHWVEFQSKFYAADGVAFNPLDFGKVLTEKKSI